MDTTTSSLWKLVGVVWPRENVWVILLVCCALALPSANSQEYIAEGCPGGQEDSPPVDVTLTCPDGQVISLGEAKFGRNKYTHCTITDGDCLDKTDAFIGCEGRHTCTVHFDRPFSPTCGYVSFITVTYDCHAVTSTPPPLVHLPSSTVSVSPPVNIVTTTTAAPDTRTDETHSGVGETGESGEDNTALIAGCVVAVIITVVLLIIAIIMVVRRLACGADLSDDEEKKSTSCHILPCIQVEQGENSPKPRQEADAQDNGDSSDKKRTKRKRKRGRWADKNQNMSPRLAPLGQEDEDQTSAAQNRILAAAARSSVHSEVGVAGGSSARSSVAMETGAQLKRHSSGARSAGSDIAKEHGGGGEVSELDEFSTWGGGGERKGAKWGTQMQGRTVGSSSGSGKMSTTSFSAPSQDRDLPSRIPKPAADKEAALMSKSCRQHNAVAVPNTEAFTSC